MKGVDLIYESSPSIKGPSLSEDDVDVWPIALDQDESKIWENFSTLSSSERCRARTFRSSVDRKRFVVARGSLRQILGVYLGVPAKHVRITYGRFGKPSLDPASSEVRFNLAHSRNFGLVAIANGRDVGVDIEYVDRKFPFLKVARLAFSSVEYSRLSKLEPGLGSETFYRLWSRKEALLKAQGVGFAPGYEPDGRTWRVADLPLGPSYTAALAVEGSIENIRIKSWTGEYDNKLIRSSKKGTRTVSSAAL